MIRFSFARSCLVRCLGFGIFPLAVAFEWNAIFFAENGLPGQFEAMEVGYYLTSGVRFDGNGNEVWSARILGGEDASDLALAPDEDEPEFFLAEYRMGETRAFGRFRGSDWSPAYALSYAPLAGAAVTMAKLPGDAFALIESYDHGCKVVVLDRSGSVRFSKTFRRDADAGAPDPSGDEWSIQPWGDGDYLLMRSHSSVAYYDPHATVQTYICLTEILWLGETGEIRDAVVVNNAGPGLGAMELNPLSVDGVLLTQKFFSNSGDTGSSYHVSLLEHDGSSLVTAWAKDVQDASGEWCLTPEGDALLLVAVPMNAIPSSPTFARFDRATGNVLGAKSAPSELLTTSGGVLHQADSGVMLLTRDFLSLAPSLEPGAANRLVEIPYDLSEIKSTGRSTRVFAGSISYDSELEGFIESSSIDGAFSAAFPPDDPWANGTRVVSFDPSGFSASTTVVFPTEPLATSEKTLGVSNASLPLERIPWEAADASIAFESHRFDFEPVVVHRCEARRIGAPEGVHAELFFAGGELRLHLRADAPGSFEIQASADGLAFEKIADFQPSAEALSARVFVPLDDSRLFRVVAAEESGAGRRFPVSALALRLLGTSPDGIVGAMLSGISMANQHCLGR